MKNIFYHSQMAIYFGVSQLMTPKASDKWASIFIVGWGPTNPTSPSALFPPFAVFGKV